MMSGDDERGCELVMAFVVQQGSFTLYLCISADIGVDKFMFRFCWLPWNNNFNSRAVSFLSMLACANLFSGW